MSPHEEMLLPCSQTSCKILGILWSELRDNQSMQMDRQGSSAEQSDNIELSQLKQCQQALELLFSCGCTACQLMRLGRHLPYISAGVRKF